MTLRRLIWRNLAHYWRMGLATALGVAAGVAAISGSLLVGDSVRISLRRLAVERLASVSHALVATHFFTWPPSSPQAAHSEGEGVPALPAILARGTARSADAFDEAAPASGVNVVAMPPEGWPLVGLGEERPAGRGALVNQPLANELGVQPGDALLLTVARGGQAPVYSIFGRRSQRDLLRTARVVVEGVLDNRFTLSRNETQPRSIYLDLAWAQTALASEGQANALLADDGLDGAALADALRNAMGLADYGVSVAEAQGERPMLAVLYDRVAVNAPLAEAVGRTAERAGLALRASSIHLANSMAPVAQPSTLDEKSAGRPALTPGPSPGGSGVDGGALVESHAGGKPEPQLAQHAGGTPAPQSALRESVPYSVVMGVEGGLEGLVREGDTPIAPDEIVLTDWAAEEMGVGPGDAVKLDWYVTRPDGGLGTEARAFRVKAVVPLADVAFSRALVPEFEGVTETASMRDWDAPFPIDFDRIRPRDEEFWRLHGPTPKAFLSMQTLREMWRGEVAEEGLEDKALVAAGREEGWLTALLVLGKEGEWNRDAFATALAAELVPPDFGLSFRPVREEALEAAQGSADFSALFLGMSFFVVAAAVGLVALLVRLSVERRASELGILQCVGFGEGAVRAAILGEGAILSLAGAVAGAWLGAGYSALVIAALAGRWQDAVAGFPIEHHTTLRGMVLGGLAGFAVAMFAVWWGAQLLRKQRTLTLLFGWRATPGPPSAQTARRAGRLARGLFALAAALGALSYRGWAVPEQAGFFGAGAALLAAGLCAARALMARPSDGPRSARSLAGMSLRDAPGTWTRDFLAAGLMAASTFILVVAGANRRDLSGVDTHRPESGAGGFALMATAEFPVHHDLGTREGLKEAVSFAEAMETLSQADIYGLRVSDGDDASCLNIQRPVAPRTLGLPDKFVRRGGFSFSRLLGETGDNPWERLLADEPDGAVPAFADAESAQWILQAGLGDVIELTDLRGRPVRLRLVGLLRESVFASELLISEANFVRHFGAESGYGMFLIAPPHGEEEAIAAALRRGLPEAGVRVRTTAEVLAEFAQVQNGYLAAFQTLGGLGLLLGVFGVVVVLLRNVWERRRELALMLALGFGRWQLAGMALARNAFGLAAGVALGAASAMLAAAPHLLSGTADVSWAALAGTLAAILAIGIASCGLAVACSVRGDLVRVIRSE